MTFTAMIKANIFNCTQCGECCQGYGGPFVSSKDIQNIAAFLKISPEKIISDYCQISGGKLLIATDQNGYCVFWDKLCTIHAVKPRMCRAWPFIENVLKDVSNWRAMASCCPGIQPDVPEQQIRTVVQYHLEMMKEKYSEL
jgi:Fe-S-cluster containining protein